LETSTHSDTDPRQRPVAGQTQPLPPGYYYPRPPSLIGGITRYITGHMLFSLLTGAIGFNVLAIPLAIILWVMGWKVGLPGHVKENVQGFFHRITGAISDEKDEVMEKLRGQREATVETLPHQTQRPTEQFSRGRPQAEPNDFPRDAERPGSRQHADDSEDPGGALLLNTLGGGGPPGTAAADRRAPPSPKKSPARPADAPAGGDYLQGLGLKAFDEPLTDKEEVP
jgi:hypothetical protein